MAAVMAEKDGGMDGAEGGTPPPKESGESIVDVVEDELADISIDLHDVGITISDTDHLPVVHLPRLVDHHANTLPSDAEVEAELESAWARAWKRIKAALDVSHYPPMVALVLVLIYGAVFAVSSFLLGYPRGVSVTNTCVAFVSKMVGKFHEFRPIQQNIERKIESVEGEASRVLRKGLDDYVAPMRHAQQLVARELDEVERALRDPRAVAALQLAAITGAADPNAPRAILDELEHMCAEAGSVLDELVALAAKLQELFDFAARFNKLIAQLVAAYFVLAGCVAAASALGQPKEGAGVAVAVNAAIGFFVFAVTLLEHVVVSRALAAAVAYANETLESFEKSVNDGVRAKLQGGDGGEGGGGGDGKDGGVVSSLVHGIVDVAGGAEGGSAGPQSIAAKIKRSVELQKLFERVAAVAKEAAGCNDVGDVLEKVEDEVEQLVGGGPGKKGGGALGKVKGFFKKIF